MIHIGKVTTTKVVQRDGTTRTSWVVSYKDNSGKRRRIYSKTEAEMFRKIAQLDSDLKAGQHNANRISFSKVAAEALEARAELVGKKNGIRSQTHKNDERHLRLYLTPHFANVQMRNLTTGDINLYINKMAADEISPKTQRHVINTLNMVCKHAVAKGYLLTNPCAKGDRQQIRGSMGERKGYTADQVQAILSAEMPLQVRAMITTAALTGLAANELQGLQWKDIDLYAGTLSVQRTGFRYMVQDETKTEYRRRSLPLPSILIKTLREWQLQCHTQVWIFPAVSGRMGEQNAWRKQVAQACKKAGVKDRGLGGFRKFYHTQMEVAGVPESIRKYRMGHSKKSNTAKVHYTDADVKLAHNVSDLETIAQKVLA